MTALKAAVLTSILFLLFYHFPTVSAPSPYISASVTPICNPTTFFSLEGTLVLSLWVVLPLPSPVSIPLPSPPAPFVFPSPISPASVPYVPLPYPDFPQVLVRGRLRWPREVEMDEMSARTSAQRHSQKAEAAANMLPACQERQSKVTGMHGGGFAFQYRALLMRSAQPLQYEPQKRVLTGSEWLHD